MCRWTPRAKQGQLNAFFPEGCVWRPRSCPLGPWGGTRLAPPAAPLDVAEALCSQVYIEDSLGERIWVDSPHCRTFVDNIQTAFNTKMPPKSALLQGEAGRSGGELSAGERCWAAGPGFPAAVGGGGPGRAVSFRGARYRRGRGCPRAGWARVSTRHSCAGSSPHPSLTEEEDSQTELLIAEEKLSPEQEGQLMPR